MVNTVLVIICNDYIFKTIEFKSSGNFDILSKTETFLFQIVIDMFSAQYPLTPQLYSLVKLHTDYPRRAVVSFFSTASYTFSKSEFILVLPFYFDFNRIYYNSYEVARISPISLKFVQNYSNLFELIQICSNLLEFGRIYSNWLQFIRIRSDLFKFVRFFFFDFFRICSILLKML